MEKALGYRRENSFLQKLVLNKFFWISFFVIAFSYPIIRSMNRELPAELPVYFKLPEYTLTNEFGKPFGSNDLKGKPYIANFVFTSCPTSCPGLMKKMQVVQKRIKGVGTKMGIVTFTVDPEEDTPAVLHKYARDYKANPHVWSFLTGTKGDIHELVVNGFKVPMGDKEPTTKKLDREEITVWDIVHTEKLVLVDSEGQIRGYYSTDKPNLDKLMIDVGLMINRATYRN